MSQFVPMPPGCLAGRDPMDLMDTELRTVKPDHTVDRRGLLINGLLDFPLDAAPPTHIFNMERRDIRTFSADRRDMALNTPDSLPHRPADLGLLRTLLR